MDVIIAGKIVSPTDTELIMGVIVAIVAMIGVSLGIGWLLSRFYSQPKRKKAFQWISTMVMIAFFSSVFLMGLVFLR